MRPSREIPDEQQIFHTITREKGSRKSDLQLEQLNDIKEMKETVDADCKTFKKEVQEIRDHLKNAKAESEALESELGSSFKRLKKMFFEEKPRNLEMLTEMSHEIADSTVTMLDRAVIAMWESQEKETKREEPIIVDLLRKIRQELEDLGKTTKEKTDDMLKEITQLKSETKLQFQSLKSTNECLDKKIRSMNKCKQRQLDEQYLNRQFQEATAAYQNCPSQENLSILNVWKEKMERLKRK